MQVSKFVPRVYDFIVTEEYNFIVMELLGKNLSNFKNSLDSHFDSEEKAVIILQQMLSAIEDLHSKGFIHRDIKPTNFVIGRDDESRVYMVDLGLARAYLDSNRSVISPRLNMDFRGTLVYASLNAHYKKDLGRRDDLWSFFFVILEFFNQFIPWRNVKDKEKIIKKKEEFINKFEISISSSMKNKIQIFDILDHIKSLRFEEKPNYAYIRNKLEDLNYIKLKKKDIEALLIIKSENFLLNENKNFILNCSNSNPPLSNIKEQSLFDLKFMGEFKDFLYVNPTNITNNYIRLEKNLEQSSRVKSYRESSNIDDDNLVRKHEARFLLDSSGDKHIESTNEFAINLNDQNTNNFLHNGKKRKRQSIEEELELQKQGSFIPKDNRSFFSKESLKKICDEVNEIYINVGGVSLSSKKKLRKLTNKFHDSLDIKQNIVKSDKNILDFLMTNLEKLNALNKKNNYNKI